MDFSTKLPAAASGYFCESNSCGAATAMGGETCRGWQKGDRARPVRAGMVSCRSDLIFSNVFASEMAVAEVSFFPAELSGKGYGCRPADRFHGAPSLSGLRMLRASPIWRPNGSGIGGGAKAGIIHRFPA